MNQLKRNKTIHMMNELLKCALEVFCKNTTDEICLLLSSMKYNGAPKSLGQRSTRIRLTHFLKFLKILAIHYFWRLLIEILTFWSNLNCHEIYCHDNGDR